MGKVARAVLMIDGDPEMRRVISARLARYGHVVSGVETGNAGLTASVRARPDLIIFDPALPDMTGLEFLKRLRSWSDVPVIVLTHEADEKSKVRLLRNGADDYVTKPCNVAELAARCEAVLRRRGSAVDKDPVVQTGPLTIDLLSRVVTLDGNHVSLTRKEFQLLHLLASHIGLVITHDQLIEGIWDNAAPNNLQYLRTLMRKLRQKLEANPSRPKLLISESGIGYRLERNAGRSSHTVATMDGPSHRCSGGEVSC